jgi:hypothetical protein
VEAAVLLAVRRGGQVGATALAQGLFWNTMPVSVGMPA